MGQPVARFLRLSRIFWRFGGSKLKAGLGRIFWLAMIFGSTGLWG
jgi:hypothetical protein